MSNVTIDDLVYPKRSKYDIKGVVERANYVLSVNKDLKKDYLVMSPEVLNKEADSLPFKTAKYLGNYAMLLCLGYISLNWGIEHKQTILKLSGVSLLAGSLIKAIYDFVPLLKRVRDRNKAVNYINVLNYVWDKK